MEPDHLRYPKKMLCLKHSLKLLEALSLMVPMGRLHNIKIKFKSNQISL